jgi:hypothetical protein
MHVDVDVDVGRDKHPLPLTASPSSSPSPSPDHRRTSAPSPQRTRCNGTKGTPDPLPHRHVSYMRCTRREQTAGRSFKRGVYTLPGNGRGSDSHVAPAWCPLGAGYTVRMQLRTGAGWWVQRQLLFTRLSWWWCWVLAVYKRQGAYCGGYGVFLSSSSPCFTAPPYSSS